MSYAEPFVDEITEAHRVSIILKKTTQPVMVTPRLESSQALCPVPFGPNPVASLTSQICKTYRVTSSLQTSPTPRLCPAPPPRARDGQPRFPKCELSALRGAPVSM